MQMLRKAAGLWRIDSDEIFDVWSGLNLDNGFSYRRFPGVKREMQSILQGAKVFFYSAVKISFWRNCQHFDFPTC